MPFITPTISSDFPFLTAVFSSVERSVNVTANVWEEAFPAIPKMSGWKSANIATEVNISSKPLVVNAIGTDSIKSNAKPR